MGAKTHRDLFAWQLANELRREIVAFTSTPPASNDRRFCQNIRDAIASVCRNLAEGFSRYRHKEFAYLVNVALGSVGEVQDQLEDALIREFVTNDRFDRMWTLSKRTGGACVKLAEYLRNNPDPPRENDRGKPR